MSTRNTLSLGLLFLIFSLNSLAQEIKFTEFDLSNGLHVILHQNKTAPVVAVSVMYHVGSKDEDTKKTGMAHFFEHLLFEGSEHMTRGEFMQIVSSSGGQNNANTTQDRTFYYEVFPSNQLELGLWLESERMLHPKIEATGVKIQNEVVKEEKRQRIDNKPYGKATERIFGHLFQGHPYQWQPIGSMAHLDAAKLEDFTDFFKRFYPPNNAVLTITGDLDIERTTKLVAKYFDEIPRGPEKPKINVNMNALTQQKIDTVYDGNIQMPMIFTAYRVPGMNSRESAALSMISSILSGGGSSRLNKKMVDEKKTALQVAAFNYALEDSGAFFTYASPNNNTSLNVLLADMDSEIELLKNELLSDSELKKVRSSFENSFVSVNTKMIGIAENLSNGYMLHNKNTNQLNEIPSVVRAISPDELRDVARKYLNSNQRIVLYYLAKK
ncbi:insulinase family protein [Pedobacter psychrodurus]|uniref:Insulinase family protein n=1 Tax=Pedobacter psychrodurus TaxID=2530456 RepID=A0A4R0PZM2_9SPHI|nr:pitrilysin family protein [Pedobacter psychrodurus]TCD28712.1 insulinase family protein [Pedobacter psychrodurus]